MFKLGLFTNKFFLVAIGGSIFMQLLVIYLPFLQVRMLHIITFMIFTFIAVCFRDHRIGPLRLGTNCDGVLDSFYF